MFLFRISKDHERGKHTKKFLVKTYCTDRHRGLLKVAKQFWALPCGQSLPWPDSARSLPGLPLGVVVVVIDDTAIIYSNEALPCNGNGKKKAQV